MTDELDRRLIDELARDARQTSSRLSDKLGVSDTTIRHRINRLQKQKIINNTTVVANAVKLGYSVNVLIVMQIDLDSIDVVGRELSNHPNVLYVAECTGYYDMFVEVWLESTQHLTRFIKEFIARLPGIRNSDTFVILDVHKNDVGWLQSSG